MELPKLVLPPLKRGGLFRLANDDGRNYPIACIGNNGGPYTMIDFARGYFAAGERLLQSVHQKRIDLDLLIYPTVYVYRHGIELSLKYLAERLPILLGIKGKFAWGHDLLKNWDQVRALLAQSRTEFPGEKSIRERPLRWMDGVLKQFVQIDPNGTTFRYPKDGKGKNRLARRSHVNYTKFAQYVQPMAEQFERWMIAIDQMIYEMN